MYKFLFLFTSLLGWVATGSAQVVLEKLSDDTKPADAEIAIKDTVPAGVADSLFYEVEDAFQEEADTLIKHFDNVDYMKIVILLPFQFNKNSGFYSSKLDDKSKTATFLYEGMKMALDSLGRLGLYADVHVVDNTDNPNAVDSIFRLGHVRGADLILGPVYNPSIRVATGLNVKAGLRLVSPLSPSSGLASGNGLFLQLNPSLEVLQRNLLVECVKKQRNRKIYIIDKMEEEENVRRMKWQKLLDVMNKDNSAPVEFIRINLFDDWTYRFDTLSENVLIVNSFKEGFVKEVSDKLKLLPANVLFSIYGMPAWRDFKSMKDMFYGKSVYCEAPFFYDNTAANYLDICQKFKKSNALLPNETIVKGFDMMMFFGWQMLKYKKDFWKYNNGAVYDGITSYYKIGESRDADTGVLNYLENKYSFLLVFNSYEKRWIRYIGDYK
jgi:hypothetical protein